MTRKGTTLPGAALTLAVLGLLGVPASSSADSCPNANVQPDPAAISEQDYNTSILCELNQVRTSRGLHMLLMNRKLSIAAGRHSASEKTNGYLAHASASGAPFTARIIATGYLKRARAWALGENLAWGDYSLGTPAALVAAWMNSPHHRRNILTRRYRDIGIGTTWGSPIADQPNRGAVVTTDFGYVRRR